MRIRSLFSALLLAAIATQSFAEDKQFGMKEENPQVGTMLKREYVHGPLPFDKTYEELTPQQRAEFKSRYVSLGANDEPPFPKNGLKQLYMVIQKAQTKLHSDGHLEMQVMIGADGKATEVAVYHSPDPEITRVVAQLAMLTPYKPGKINGVPSAMAFPIDVDFKVGLQAQ
ncbi:MAG: energy transducer TonB [Burkholderiaceae bacterium]|nr:energy transducer TonB [Burkholderiaceae bacterium]